MARLMRAILLGAGLLLAWRFRHSIPGWWSSFRTSSVPSARLYDFLAELALPPLYRRIVRETLEGQGYQAILDAGCGPGTLSVLLGAAQPRFRVTGLDISPEMVELAANRAREAGLDDRVSFREGDVAALPFADGEFDLVLSSLSRHHWADPVQGLREIRRVLKRGGEVRIYDVADWFAHIETHGPTLKELAASGIFEEASVEPYWRLGSFVVLSRLTLR